MTAQPRVVHRSAHLLVLDKPSGLPTTAPPGRDSLAARAATLDPKAPRLHATSRLDAPVSGLVTFARTRRGNDALLAARRAGTYARQYLGLTGRAPDPREGRWAEAIGPHPEDRRLRAVGEGPPAKPAATRYATLAEVGGAALLSLRPETGRTHQLRVHAAAAGVPLLGDAAYGGARRVVRPDGRVLTARRVLLHCAELRFPDPETGEMRVFASPAPADLAGLWGALGGAAEALVV
ncbi:MAG: RluA family pseudouridine synthase [Myxococcota bacterium]